MQSYSCLFFLTLLNHSKAAVAAQASSGKRKTGKAVSKTVEAIVGINIDTDQLSLVGGFIQSVGGRIADRV